MNSLINWFCRKKDMSQAKVLNEREIKKCLFYISARRHASRNRCMFLLTHQSGMRVGEVAALRICDVLTTDGQIKEEVRLSAEQTKGDKARMVYLPTKLQQELKSYLLTRFKVKDLQPIMLTDTSRALFGTQKNSIRGFSSNTLCQFFHYMYKDVGLSEASSHSGRRGFITNLANKGISVRVLQELAGHRSLAVTQRYIEVNHQLMRNAVELVCTRSANTP
jgi:integrase/recombinase XerD